MAKNIGGAIESFPLLLSNTPLPTCKYLSHGRHFTMLYFIMPPSKPMSTAHHHSPSSLPPCRHSPSATRDILIFLLVLFSGTFLLSSYFSYLFNAFSLLISSNQNLAVPLLSYIFGCTAFCATTLISFELCCGSRSRKCDQPGCKGLKKAMEFDLKLQKEDCLNSGSPEIDSLPWKGRTEGNPDYECLRAELRKMAPPNGRAVLIFRARCGCAVARLEGWGPKRGKRHKNSLAM